MEYNKNDRGKCGIYAIRNLITGKLYIGKSKDIYRRIKTHATHLNTKSKDENRYLINAWHKYGRISFDYIVLEYLEFDNSLLSERELYWMLFYDTTNKDKGYNLRLDSTSNMVVHEDTRKLMSEKGKLRYKNNPEERKKLSEWSTAFWKDNDEAKKEMSLKVSDANKKFTIVKLTRQLEFVEEYPSQKDIRDNHPDLYLPAILQVCNGNKASYKGFYWRYRSIETGEIIPQKERRLAIIPVVMLDKETGEILKEFSSCEAAAKYLGHSKGSNINTMCRKHLFWKSKSFYFRYKHEKINYNYSKNEFEKEISIQM